MTTLATRPTTSSAIMAQRGSRDTMRSLISSIATRMVVFERAHVTDAPLLEMNSSTIRADYSVNAG